MNLKQLSKELNLSISTISKALRDSPEISAVTKKKVKAKAKELNYHANPFASNLRNQKSNTIAVIIPAIANNFFSSAINGAESFAQDKDYHVLIYQTHEDLEKEISISKHLQNGRVDGIMISLSSQTDDTSHLAALKDRGIPLVFFDRVAENIDAPKITIDDYENGYMATEHLIKNGCKKIAYLSFSSILAISNNRKEGYLAALRDHHLPINEQYNVDCYYNRAENKSKLRNLLSSPDRPDALFASVEELAIASYEVCNEINLNIPQDIKIISFSNLQTASLLNPSLTTITQPAYEIGREAASILFKLIEDKDNCNIYNNTILESTLMIRNSTKVL
jgi:LacI family transcriptional regulator